MRKTTIFFAMFLIALSFVSAYTIEGNSVVLNDSKVYISATPHTLLESGYVEFEIISKEYSGNVNVLFGFDTSITKPKKADLYKPITYQKENKLICDSNIEGRWYNNTNSNAWCWQDISPDNVSNTSSSQLVWMHEYERINHEDDSFFYNETIVKEWKDVSGYFNKINYDFDGKNVWYYVSNVSVSQGESIKFRAWLDVKFNTVGKYDFAIYPSIYGANIGQAIQNGHLYYLDPWWNTTWVKKKAINITSSKNISDYQIMLNVSYDSDMQPDFDDLRFLNEEENVSLDYYIIDKVNSSWAIVWVKIDSLDTDNGTQAYIYYNNSAVSTTGNATETFEVYEDFTTDPSWTIQGDWSWSASGYYSFSTGDCHIVHHPTYNATDVRVWGKIMLTSGTYAAAGVVSRKDSSGGWYLTRIYEQSGSGDLSTSLPNLMRCEYDSYQGNVGSSTLSSTYPAYNVWYSLRTDIVDDNISVYFVNVTSNNEAYNWEGYATFTNANYSSGYVGFGSWDTRTYARADELRVVKLMYPEPTYSFGSEQNQSVSTTESEARTAIETAVTNTLATNTVYYDQKVYTYNAGHNLGVFDLFVVSGDQRWAFNYVSDGESFTNISSIGTTLNVWENESLLAADITTQVEAYINSTVN